MYGIFHIRSVSVGLDSQIWYLFIYIIGYLNVRKISETMDFRTFVGPLIIIIEIESLKEHTLFGLKGMMTDSDFRFMANTVAGMLLSAQVMKPCNPSAEKGQTETFKEDAMFR